MKWILISSILLFSNYVYAGNFYVNGSRKVIEFVEPQAVIAVPAANIGVRYYYGVNPNPQKIEQLSEEDVQRIANATAEKVVSILTEAIEKSGVDGPKESANLDVQVQAIFAQSCARCHSEQTPRGKFEDETNVVLIDKGNLSKLDRYQREQIWDAVDTQRMPQDHDPLPVDQVETIRRWWKLTPKPEKKEGN